MRASNLLCIYGSQVFDLKNTPNSHSCVPCACVHTQMESQNEH